MLTWPAVCMSFHGTCKYCGKKEKLKKKKKKEEENPSRMGQNKKFTFHENLDGTAYVPKW